MRKLGLAVVVIAAAVLAVALLRGREDDPEAQIRAMLRAVIEATEERDLGGILDHVSREFHGQGMDRDQLKGLLFVELRRGAWRKVILYDTTITVADDRRHARVDTEALLATGDKIESIADVLPTSGDRYRFLVELAREDDDTWRATSATYSPARFGG